MIHIYGINSPSAYRGENRTCSLLHTIAKAVPKSQRFEQLFPLELYHGKTALNLVGDIQHVSQGCPGDELNPAPRHFTGYTHPLRSLMGSGQLMLPVTSPLMGPWATTSLQSMALIHLDGSSQRKRREYFSHEDTAIWQRSKQQACASPCYVRSKICSQLLVNIFASEFMTLGKDDHPGE